MSNIKSNKKKKYYKSSYDFVQFKRMIGKGLVKLWSGNVQDRKQLMPKINAIKSKIIDTKKRFKSICMTALLNDGVLYVFKNTENMLAINAIPYSVLKKQQVGIQVDVIQYEKLNRVEILTMVE